MTATTLTYLAAREHINDLRRDADLHRRTTEVSSPRRFRLALPRRFARHVARPATA